MIYRHKPFVLPASYMQRLLAQECKACRALKVEVAELRRSLAEKSSSAETAMLRRDLEEKSSSAETELLRRQLAAIARLLKQVQQDAARGRDAQEDVADLRSQIAGGCACSTCACL